jgi:hypothetical protein
VARTGVARAVLYGTLAVGTLDILDALIFFGLRSGARPQRILQGIAGGLLTRPVAQQGGWPTAALGLFLHYFIAFGIVTVYMLASRQMRALAKRPLLFGLLYGIAVYFVMNVVVVPLSRIGGSFTLVFTPVLINGLLIHMFGVGLPSALAAAAAEEPGTRRTGRG